MLQSGKNTKTASPQADRSQKKDGHCRPFLTTNHRNSLWMIARKQDYSE